MKYLTLRAQIAGEPIHKAKHLFGKLLRIEIFAVVPEIKAVYEHVLHFWFIIFNRGGGGRGMWLSVTYFLRGCIANRHTTSQRGGRGSKNGKKSVTYFLNGPLRHFGVRSSYLFDAPSKF